jgi:hypothetical protein
MAKLREPAVLRPKSSFRFGASVTRNPSPLPFTPKLMLCPAVTSLHCAQWTIFRSAAGTHVRDFEERDARERSQSLASLR